MYILGINAYHGDAAAALIKDGRIVAAVEEERFNRIKHCAGFPTEPVKYCLRVAGIEIDAGEHVCVARHFITSSTIARISPVRFSSRRLNARRCFRSTALATLSRPCGQPEKGTRLRYSAR